jgi:hypothetical protein
MWVATKAHNHFDDARWAATADGMPEGTPSQSTAFNEAASERMRKYGIHSHCHNIGWAQRIAHPTRTGQNLFGTFRAR